MEERECHKCNELVPVTHSYCHYCGAENKTPEQVENDRIESLWIVDYLDHIGLGEVLNLKACYFNDDYLGLVTKQGTHVFCGYESNWKKQINGKQLVNIKTTLDYFNKYDDLERFKRKVAIFGFYKKAFEALSLVLQMEDIMWEQLKEIDK